MKSIEITNQPLKQNRAKLIIKTFVLTGIITAAITAIKTIDYLSKEYGINKTNSYVGFTILSVFVLFPLIVFLLSDKKNKTKISISKNRRAAVGRLNRRKKKNELAIYKTLHL